MHVYTCNHNYLSHFYRCSVSIIGYYISCAFYSDSEYRLVAMTFFYYYNTYIVQIQPEMLKLQSRGKRKLQSSGRVSFKGPVVSVLKSVHRHHYYQHMTFAMLERCTMTLGSVL